MNPITLLAYVSDICNMNCRYCYNIFPRSNKMIDCEGLFDFICDLHNKTNRNIIVLLIGGEPTLHPKLMELIEKLKEEDYINGIDIFTNFSQNYEYYERLIDKGVNITASWHGCCDDNDFINKLMNIPLSKQKQICEIAMMYEKDNKERWKYVIHQLNGKFNSVICPWLIYEKFKLEDYSTEEIEFYSKTVLHEKLINIKELGVHKNLYQEIFNNSKLKYMDNIYGKNCSAGYDTYYLHSDYNLYKCQNDFYYGLKPLYNISENNFKFNVNFYKNSICKCQYCRHGNFDVKTW